MQQRRKLIEDYLSRTFSKSELAERYDISRPTVDLWIKRFEAEGFPGLDDRSHRPQKSPARTSSECEQLLISTRQTHPGWGPRTLRSRLRRSHPQIEMPALSTIGEILKRNGLITSTRRRRRSDEAIKKPVLGEITQPNQLWNIDFKGEFLLGNAQYCYPLTISDTYSRYLLCAEAFDSTKLELTRRQLERVFAEYGLPAMLRSDNGTPFVGNGRWGLSRLMVWWIRLGIIHIRTRRASPQDNGQHERMHKTLKAGTTRPPEKDFCEQQVRFDEFRSDFNEHRTHQGIDDALPSELYTASARRLPERLEAIDYPGHYQVRLVSSNGVIKFGNQEIFLSETLEHERVGLEEIDDQIWSIYLSTTMLGRLDMATRTVH